MKLKNCIDIETGYPASRLNDKPVGNAYYVVSIPNITGDELLLDLDSLKKMYSPSSLKFLKAGDILLTNRNKLATAVVPKYFPHKLITKDFVTTLRIRKYFKDDILPEYLAICLRSEKIMHELLRNSTTSVRSIVIPNNAILELDINFPDLQMQKQIVQCYTEIDVIKQNYAHKVELLNKIQNSLQKGIHNERN